MAKKKTGRIYLYIYNLPVFILLTYMHDIYGHGVNSDSYQGYGVSYSEKIDFPRIILGIYLTLPR